MWKYVFKRILQLIPSFIIVSFVVFWLMSMSGDPASVKAGVEASPEQIEAMREAMGLNRPLIVRYLEYAGNLLQGDMGDDIYGNPVWPVFAQRFPFTLLLTLFSVTVSSLIAIPAGIGAALHKDSLADTGLTVMCLFLNCMPVFWLGMMLQTIFCVKLGWLPTSGISKGILISLILPGFTSVFTSMAAKCRQTRSAMLDNLNADYMRTALAKGVRYKDAVNKHALRNALLPIITVIGNAITLSFGGNVSLETIFSWPGLGSAIVPAVKGADYGTACGCIVMTTFMVGFMNLAVDIAYAFADPRVKARYAGK